MNQDMNDTKKIALFYGGKISRHLVMIREAARKEGVELDLISYNQVCFETGGGEVKIRGKSDDNKGKSLEGYSVLFFRTTGKHWEEVDLILRQVQKLKNKPIIVDPLVELGKPSMACKAWQMLVLSEAGLRVPRTVYGSLWYLYQFMESSQNTFCGARPLRQHTLDAARLKSNFASIPLLDRDQKKISSKSHGHGEAASSWQFPVILKGSGGDRGTRVFRADNLEQLERLVRELRKSETEEGRRYMIQEWIENEGDYRVLVLGEKVLGVMKRSRLSEKEYRNNYSMGGKVEVTDLPEEIKRMAVKAARVCGLMVAGVDVMFCGSNSCEHFSSHCESVARLNVTAKKIASSCAICSDPRNYVVLEVNKGPQFRGFMEATGIDVPREIVRFLVGLAK